MLWVDSSAASKSFVLLWFWNLRIVLKQNPCFWKNLHSLYIFVMMGLSFALEVGNPARVGYEVLTSQGYTKVELVKAWLVSSSLARLPTVLMWYECCFYVPNLLFNGYQIRFFFAFLKAFVLHCVFHQQQQWRFSFFWSQGFKCFLREIHVSEDLFLWTSS